MSEIRQPLREIIREGHTLYFHQGQGRGGEVVDIYSASSTDDRRLPYYTRSLAVHEGAQVWNFTYSEADAVQFAYAVALPNVVPESKKIFTLINILADQSKPNSSHLLCVYDYKTDALWRVGFHDLVNQSFRGKRNPSQPDAYAVLRVQEGSLFFYPKGDQDRHNVISTSKAFEGKRKEFYGHQFELFTLKSAYIMTIARPDGMIDEFYFPRFLDHDFGKYMVDAASSYWNREALDVLRLFHWQRSPITSTVNK